MTALKCEKCNFVSFDYNITCPQCGQGLSKTREKLGIHYTEPTEDFDTFFGADSGANIPIVEKDAVMIVDDLDTEVEFTLDDVGIEEETWSLDD